MAKAAAKKTTKKLSAKASKSKAGPAAPASQDPIIIINPGNSLIIDSMDRFPAHGPGTATHPYRYTLRGGDVGKIKEVIIERDRGETIVYSPPNGDCRITIIYEY